MFLSDSHRNHLFLVHTNTQQQAETIPFSYIPIHNNRTQPSQLPLNAFNVYDPTVTAQVRLLKRALPLPFTGNDTSLTHTSSCSGIHSATTTNNNSFISEQGLDLHTAAHTYAPTHSHTHSYTHNPPHSARARRVSALNTFSYDNIMPKENADALSATTIT
ncbi:hypothetical protein SARC_14702, partial [Sphaeroforma arctica JP610]